jgi:hypothetical protein
MEEFQLAFDENLQHEDHQLNIFQETSFCPNHVLSSYKSRWELQQSEFAFVSLYRQEDEILDRLSSCFKVSLVIITNHLVDAEVK